MTRWALAVLAVLVAVAAALALEPTPVGRGEVTPATCPGCAPVELHEGP